MSLKHFKTVGLSVVMMSFFLLISCKKNDDELKRQIAELASRVTNIENQLTQINKDLVTLQQQGKLNTDEVNALKSLTTNLSTITDDIKNNTAIHSKALEDLKTSLQQTASTVQFDDLKQTITQLTKLVNDNYFEQKLTDENTNQLNLNIAQIAADLDKLKSVSQITKLDRPINLKASQGDFGNRIIVTWTPMPNAKNYQLFKFNDNTGNYDMVKEGIDTTFTDLSAFEPYKKAFYKVKIVNSPNVFSSFSDVNYGYTSGQNFSKYLSFGFEGSAMGLFEFPMHIAVDAANNIYVSDEGNNRVQKFDRQGNFKEVFYNGSRARAIAFLKNGNAVATRTQSSSYIQILDPQKNILKEWGTYGTADTQFGNIEEITVDDEDNIYVVDGINNSIKKFDQNGNFLLKFEGATRVEGQIEEGYPFGICFYNNKLFVTSPRNSLIRVFDKQGNYLKSWDAGSTCHAIKAFKNHLYIACDTYVLKTDEGGEIKEKIGQGQFFNVIAGLAVNSDEEIIVSDVYARSIKVFKQL